MWHTVLTWALPMITLFVGLHSFYRASNMLSDLREIREHESLSDMVRVMEAYRPKLAFDGHVMVWASIALMLVLTFFAKEMIILRFCISAFVLSYQLSIVKRSRKFVEDLRESVKKR